MTKITVTNVDVEADIKTDTDTIPPTILAVGFLQQILSIVVDALRQQADADKSEE